MAQEIFQRYEKKYLLTEEKYRQMMLLLDGILELDQYGRHTISNIYFDTPDYQLIRTSLEKPVYKEKVRLRGYGQLQDDSAEVFLELKKKYDSVVYKRRMEMSLGEARAYLYEGICPSRQDQIFQELDYCMKRYDLKPMAYISYERMAYTCSRDPEVRVTFDRNLLGRSRELELGLGTFGMRLLEPEQVLMEIKVPGAVPLWMSRTFSDLGIFPTSFSKYGTFYQTYICAPPEPKAALSRRSVLMEQNEASWAMREADYGEPEKKQQNQGGRICA